MIVIDIGGATVEGAAVRKYVKDGKEEFVRTDQAASSWNGALKLITLFKHKIQNLAGDKFHLFEESLRKPDETSIQWFWDDFDIAKRTFNNRDDQIQKLQIPMRQKVMPADIHIPPTLLKHLEFSSKDKCFFLSYELVKAIFDEWLNDVVDLIVDFIVNLNSRCAESRPWVALCGWGSLPPYILTEIRSRLAQKKHDVQVECIEIRTQSIVAQGNFINLMCQDLFSVQLARKSYGILCDIPVDHIPPSIDIRLGRQTAKIGGKTFLCRRVLWVVKKGTELSTSEGTLTQAVQATKIFTQPNTPRSMFPLDWNIDLVVSSHDDVTTDDTYQFQSIEELVAASKAEIEDGSAGTIYGHSSGLTSRLVDPADKSQGRFVEFKFRVRMDFQDQVPKLVMCIARGGEFQSPLTPNWTEKREKEDCTTIEVDVGGLFTHATSRGVMEAQIDAGWPVSDDENGETKGKEDTEMEGTADGGEMQG